nr:hypothetical protein [Rahnella sp. WMR121]
MSFFLLSSFSNSLSIYLFNSKSSASFSSVFIFLKKSASVILCVFSVLFFLSFPPFSFNRIFLKNNPTLLLFFIFSSFCSCCCFNLCRNSGFLFFLRCLSFKNLTVGLRLTGFLVAKCLANVVSSSALLISLFSNASRAFAIANSF